MKPDSLDAARKEFDRAQMKVAAMRMARDQKDLANTWSEFLVISNLVFSRLADGAKSGPSRGWFDKIKHFRGSDELLQYVYQARHAHEHGIKPITKHTPQAITLTGKNVNIKNLRIGKGKIEAEHYQGSLSIGFNPGGVKLLSVVNRNKEYNPPRTHMSKAWGQNDPISIAQAHLEYTRDILSEAESFAAVDPTKT